MGALDALLEGLERVVPELIEPAAQFAESMRIDVVHAARAFGSIGHQSRLLQRLQMLRDGRATDLHAPGDDGPRLPSAPPPLAHRAAPGGTEVAPCISASHYLRSEN